MDCSHYESLGLRARQRSLDQRKRKTSVALSSMCHWHLKVKEKNEIDQIQILGSLYWSLFQNLTYLPSQKGKEQQELLLSTNELYFSDCNSKQHQAIKIVQSRYNKYSIVWFQLNNKNSRMAGSLAISRVLQDSMLGYFGPSCRLQVESSYESSCP